MVDVYLRESISFKLDDIPEFVHERIIDSLTIPNPAYASGLKEAVWNLQDIPEFLELYEIRSGWINMPRGYWDWLITIFIYAGIDVQYVDKRERAAPTFHGPPRFPLRQYQQVAATELLLASQGIYQASPGAGKTIVMLDVIRQAKQPALVIVNTTHIARQWQERCEQYLGFTPGLIGDGVWEEGPLTIALNQTLDSQFEMLYATGWFDNWGLVCIDECHHVSAPSFFRAFNSFPAYYRFGLSATPDRQNGLSRVVTATIGGVVHETSADELVSVLVTPKVKIIETEFEHDFWSTHTVGEDEECEKPGCELKRLHMHRNNYQDILNALVSDVERNMDVALEVYNNQEHCNLVLSKRIKHLKILREYVDAYGVFDDDRLFMLTGNESSTERARVAKEADAGSCVIFSTIADEALDIPRLDRLYLAWPTRNQKIVQQQLGRIERAHPDKKDALAYDFADRGCGPLENQFRERRRYYLSRDLDILT